MTLLKDIMSYFNKKNHVHGYLYILWSHLKNMIPQNFTIVNFRHPVNKSWLRPWRQHHQLISTIVTTTHFC